MDTKVDRDRGKSLQVLKNIQTEQKNIVNRNARVDQTLELRRDAESGYTGLISG